MRLLLGFAAIVIVGSLLSSSVGFAARLGVRSSYLTFSESAVASSTTCTLSATADGSIRRNQPGNNFGSADTLDVRSGNAARRLFARFDLASCAIPGDAIVTSAGLRLTLAAAPSSTRTLAAHRITADWEEGALTWANQPSVAAAPSSSTLVVAGSAEGTRLEWSVTADVQLLVAGLATHRGWRLVDAAEEDNAANAKSFHSREADTGVPQLVISFVS